MPSGPTASGVSDDAGHAAPVVQNPFEFRGNDGGRHPEARSAAPRTWSPGRWRAPTTGNPGRPAIATASSTPSQRASNGARTSRRRSGRRGPRCGARGTARTDAVQRDRRRREQDRLRLRERPSVLGRGVRPYANEPICSGHRCSSPRPKTSCCPSSSGPSNGLRPPAERRGRDPRHRRDLTWPTSTGGPPSSASPTPGVRSSPSSTERPPTP